MTRKLVAKKPFEFSARVTLQLGRESISNSTVAISELIKNSYDADANSVDLRFEIRQHSVSTLVIEDDGIGMTCDSLISNWLKIGTDNKSLAHLSQIKKRVLTGAKGLGRLGIDRLCKKLVLYTKEKGADSALQLIVDWSKFENSTLSLSDIEHEIYEVELPVKDRYGEYFTSLDDSGTRMVLLGLKDDWDQDYLEKLENELRLLVSPFQAENEFGIRVLANRYGELSERIVNSSRFLDLARWKISGQVDSEGTVSINFSNNKKKIDILQSKIPWHDWIKGVGDELKFGPIEFEFHYLSQDQESKDLLKKVNLSARDLKRFMALNRGFRIYRDHFRVRPYGEPSGKGDWLDIGYRKSSSPGGIKQGGWRIGPNQILGAVLISRNENSILNDQANREGLVENEAFYQLRSFLLKTIETFELLAHKDAAGDKETDLSRELAEILAKSQDDVEEAIFGLKQSISASSKIKKNKKKQIPLKQQVANKLAEFERAQKRQREAEKKYLNALQEEKGQLEEQKNTLSNLASLGILTVCFGHEVRQHSAKAAADAELIICCLNDDKSGVRELNVDDFKDIALSIKDSVKYIENFSDLALKNVNPDKRTRRKVSVPRIFEYVFGLMSDTLESMNVKYSLTYRNVIEDEIRVTAFEIDWESIAINLITNSLWAMEKPREGVGREIEIEFSKQSSDQVWYLISFRDSGVGLENGMGDDIFLPMQSGKRDKTGNVIGTGMGLAIVKNHVNDHMGGEVSVNGTSALGGAEFNFKIPAK